MAIMLQHRSSESDNKIEGDADDSAGDETTITIIIEMIFEMILIMMIT